MEKRSFEYKKSCGCKKHVSYYGDRDISFLHPTFGNVGYLKNFIEPDKIIHISTKECDEHKIEVFNRKIEDLTDLINNNSYEGRKEQLYHFRNQLIKMKKEYIEKLRLNDKESKHEQKDADEENNKTKKKSINFSTIMKNTLHLFYLYGIFLF